MAAGKNHSKHLPELPTKLNAKDLTLLRISDNYHITPKLYETQIQGIDQQNT
jgi:hypothetical protein